MGLYLRKNSTVWCMRYGVDGKRRDETTGTRDRKKAALVLKQKLAECAQRRLAAKIGLSLPQGIGDSRLTLEAFFERYREHYRNAGGPALRQSRERSWGADQAALRSVIDFIARKGVGQLAKVERRHVEAYRDWRLTTGVSGATVNKAIRVGRAAWSWAIRIGLALEPHPFKGVKAVKVPQYEPRALSEIEVARLLLAARDEQALPVVASAVFAAPRNSELAALDWSDFDWRGGFIRVRCDETFNTKSRKPRRVPIADELRAVLEPLAKPAGLCFPSPRTGAPWTPQGLCAAIRRIAKRAGVEFSLHDLRRTFASILADRGVPPSRIRDYLGHASLATTEGYYLARGRSASADDVNHLRFGLDGKRSEKAAPKIA